VWQRHKIEKKKALLESVEEIWQKEFNEKKNLAN
jgi:hypothetical protein